jgi:hypothetical protein
MAGFVELRRKISAELRLGGLLVESWGTRRGVSLKVNGCSASKHTSTRPRRKVIRAHHTCSRSDARKARALRLPSIEV